MKPSFYPRSVRRVRRAEASPAASRCRDLLRSTVLRLYASLTGGVGRFAAR